MKKQTTAHDRLRRLIDAKRREVDQLARQSAQALRDIDRLTRLLNSLDREGVADRLIARSSSARRILVDQLLLRRLDVNRGRLTSSNELWPIAAGAGVQSRSTFRSFLRRLSEKGLIASGGPGLWRLADNVVVDRKHDPALAEAIRRISG